MALNGYNAEQPLSVRLFLALSVALLCHTLLAALIALPGRPDAPQSHTLRLTLATPAQTIREATSTASQPSERLSASANTDRQPATTETTDASRQRRPDTKAAPPEQDRGTSSPVPGTTVISEATTETDSASASPIQPKSASRPANTTEASESAAPTTVSEGKQPGQTQLTRTPEQTDPYVAKLWQAIGQAIDQQGIRNLRDLDSPRTLRLTLQLLPSGAITRADVTSSSGISSLDQIAHRAALRASPYPPVPETHAGRRQFELTLSFRPTPRKN